MVSQISPKDLVEVRFLHRPPMKILKRSIFHQSLVKERCKYFDKAISVFKCESIEAHVIGSIARGDSDPYSDIDLWFTFDDADISNVLEIRNELFAQIGEVVHVCEPPQNRPPNGIQSSVLIKTVAGLLVLDISLCPKSSAYSIKEAKKIFGDIVLPESTMGYNPQKVTVDDLYRIDFVILFVFGAIKKIVRKEAGACNSLIEQYGYLYQKYNIEVDPFINMDNKYDTIRQVIVNLIKVSNDKQKKALSEVESFLNVVETLED